MTLSATPALVCTTVHHSSRVNICMMMIRWSICMVRVVFFFHLSNVFFREITLMDSQMQQNLRHKAEQGISRNASNWVKGLTLPTFDIWHHLLLWSRQYLVKWYSIFHLIEVEDTGKKEIQDSIILNPHRTRNWSSWYHGTSPTQGSHFSWTIRSLTSIW